MGEVSVGDLGAVAFQDGENRALRIAKGIGENRESLGGMKGDEPPGTAHVALGSRIQTHAPVLPKRPGDGDRDTRMSSATSTPDNQLIERAIGIGVVGLTEIPAQPRHRGEDDEEIKRIGNGELIQPNSGLRLGGDNPRDPTRTLVPSQGVVQDSGGVQNTPNRPESPSTGESAGKSLTIGDVRDHGGHRPGEPLEPLGSGTRTRNDDRTPTGGDDPLSQTTPDATGPTGDDIHPAGLNRRPARAPVERDLTKPGHPTTTTIDTNLLDPGDGGQKRQLHGQRANRIISANHTSTKTRPLQSHTARPRTNSMIPHTGNGQINPQEQQPQPIGQTMSSSDQSSQINHTPRTPTTNPDHRLRHPPLTNQITERTRRPISTNNHNTTTNHRSHRPDHLIPTPTTHNKNTPPRHIPTPTRTHINPLLHQTHNTHTHTAQLEVADTHEHLAGIVGDIDVEQNLLGPPAGSHRATRPHPACGFQRGEALEPSDAEGQIEWAGSFIVLLRVRIDDTADRLKCSIQEGRMQPVILQRTAELIGKLETCQSFTLTSIDPGDRTERGAVHESVLQEIRIAVLTCHLISAAPYDFRNIKENAFGRSPIAIFESPVRAEFFLSLA